MITTPRHELDDLRDRLYNIVPDPLHSVLEKEEPAEAIRKYRERKQKETPICPPTCTGISFNIM